MVRIVLLYPKFEVNVANVQRNCSIFGVDELIVVGHRYIPASGEKGDRKPKPFRMEEWNDIKVTYIDEFRTKFFREQSFIVIEKLDWTPPLELLVIPPNPTYIFGPEDGNVPKWIVDLAKHHAHLPGKTPLNLAVTTGIVLYHHHLVKQHCLFR